MQDLLDLWHWLRLFFLLLQLPLPFVLSLLKFLQRCLDFFLGAVSAAFAAFASKQAPGEAWWGLQVPGRMLPRDGGGGTVVVAAEVAAGGRAMELCVELFDGTELPVHGPPAGGAQQRFFFAAGVRGVGAVTFEDDF